MIRSISIQGFRCFDSFEATGFGRVNLLIGRNNSGKTALLEAVELVSWPEAHPFHLLLPLQRRGESTVLESEQPGARGYTRQYEVFHLFARHELHSGSSFEVAAHTDAGRRHVRCDVRPYTDEEQGDLFPGAGVEAGELPGPLAITVEAFPGGRPRPARLTAGGRIDPRSRFEVDRMPHFSDKPEAVIFCVGGSLSPELAASSWNQLVLTPDEERVVRAMQVVEPTIEQVAYVGPTRRYGPDERGGFAVKCRQTKQRVPIGSLGDGTWHMFSLALALTRSKGGVLLVDEIDTGLHHTVMGDMWRMLIETSERLDVQVFATTHSSDCVTSLAAVAGDKQPGVVSVQRVEREKGRTVAYSQKQIAIAAERGIEVR